MLLEKFIQVAIPILYIACIVYFRDSMVIVMGFVIPIVLYAIVYFTIIRKQNEEFK